MEEENNDFWEEGSFAETLSSEEVKEKMKTFYKKHDEDMNYNCRECSRKISAHNKDWHNGMCDDCFDMSEIAFGARSFASAKSKPAISESQKPLVSDDAQKPQLLTHAQEHALGSSKMLRIFDCAQKPSVSDISPGVLDKMLGVKKHD